MPEPVLRELCQAMVAMAMDGSQPPPGADGAKEPALMRDPFTVLGVDEAADDAEIRRRYLALVRDFPPDRAPERFREYRAAYEALSDERETAGDDAASHQHGRPFPAVHGRPARPHRPDRRAQQAGGGGPARRGNHADRDGQASAR